ncbi:hypothetical protein roselon_02841 [Roseibacterium elongatum DSM 19469]|uniref:Uncharacterized protein n=1 Tax=Roseicyclus elongatus DSM 19469 TaxID=1294273 RepID=W8RVA4_9RHOB|nr:hypothetical protein roselon_02841 [Roseibacterium elongatum DSM 19469]
MGYGERTRDRAIAFHPTDDLSHVSRPWHKKEPAALIRAAG